MIRGLAYPLWMLIFASVAVARRDLTWCALAGAVGLGVQIIAERAWRTTAGRLARANLLTIARLGLVVSLPIAFVWFPRALFAPLVVVILTLDGIDGWIARARGESSAFGATLDMETDALTVMLLSLLLWSELGVGSWVLIAGGWRYVYAASIALVPSLGDCPRSGLYRRLFFAMMVAFVGAFLPWPGVAAPLAAVGTVLVSVSFLHSLVRSRAFSRRFVIASVRP